MNDGSDRFGNRLLAALTEADWQRWRPHLERVDLKLGQVLYEPGRAQRHAYFPTSAIVSLTCVLSNGSPTGISLVGNEGVVGTSLFLGGTSTTGYGSVLIAGQGFRVGARMIREEFDRSSLVRLMLLRYTQALVAQIAQIAICNRLHSVDQQVCNWLLHSLDRLPGGEFAVTHQLIANVLGVRRESVTEAARKLQAAGVIRYAYGHISVLDRGALAQRSCPCHASVKNEYERLLPQDRHGRQAAPSPCTRAASDRTALAGPLRQSQVAESQPS